MLFAFFFTVNVVILRKKLALNEFFLSLLSFVIVLKCTPRVLVSLTSCQNSLSSACTRLAVPLFQKNLLTLQILVSVTQGF